jgi:hypothetical protein
MDPWGVSSLRYQSNSGGFRRISISWRGRAVRAEVGVSKKKKENASD